MTRSSPARAVYSAHDILRKPQRASGPALRTFERIADRWALVANERYAILGLTKSSYYNYRAHPERARLSPDTLERVSYILGIFKALRILLPRQEAADAWIKRPNDGPLFGGKRPIDIMAGGKVINLYSVRHFLDGQRGW